MSERTIHNPKTGETFVFLQTAAETGGELFRMSYAMAPHGRIADEHDHPNQEMTISVTSGALTCTVDGVDRILSAGESVVVPAGVSHFQRNDGDQEAHAIEEYRPALQMQGFFEVLSGWANDGKTNQYGMPDRLRLAMLLRYFRKSIRSSSRRANLQSLLLAPIAEMLGYRRELERYTSDT